MKKRKSLLVVGSICLVLVLAVPSFMVAFAEPKSATTKPFDEELVVAMDTFTTENALPPMGAFGDLGLWMSLYEYLVYRDPKTGRPTVPGVAERWEFSKDMSKYTFYLRKGIQFHGGWGEVTAEDVKLSYTMIARKDSLSPRGRYFRDIVKSIEVENPYKITFHLTKSDWQFIENCANWLPFTPVICKKYIDTVGEKEANLKPIGSGPYRLVDRRAGDYIKFEAVPDHWRNVPEFKRVTLRCVPEVSTRLSMLRAGEADIVPVPADKVKEVEKAGFRLVENKGALLYWMVLGSLPFPTRKTFDPTVPWWADPANSKEWERARKVRMAMNLAVNRMEIIDKLFLGKAIPFGTACVWPGEPGWDPAWKPYPYDPKKAKQLLAEAGYPNGFEATVYPMSMPARPEGKMLAEAVSIYWEKIGIKVKREVKDWVTIKPTMFKRNTKGCWIYGMLWYDEPSIALFRQSSSFNIWFTGAEHKFLDEQARKVLPELDKEKRSKITREWGQFFYDNYFAVPLCGKPKLWAVSKRVGKWPTIPGVMMDSQNLDYVTLNR